jgi:hypothetical protein
LYNKFREKHKIIGYLSNRLVTIRFCVASLEKLSLKIKYLIKKPGLLLLLIKLYFPRRKKALYWMVQIFWDITPCQLENGYRRFEHDGTRSVAVYFGKYLPIKKAQN